MQLVGCHPTKFVKKIGYTTKRYLEFLQPKCTIAMFQKSKSEKCLNFITRDNICGNTCDKNL